MSCLHAVIKTINLRSKSNGIVIEDGVSSKLEAKSRVLLSSRQNDAVELSRGKGYFMVVGQGVELQQ